MTHAEHFTRNQILKLARDVVIDSHAERVGNYFPEARTLPAGSEYRVEGWVDELGGYDHAPWQVLALTGNPAAMQYAFRAVNGGLPMDNEVLYGHVGTLGYMLHRSEVETLPEVK